MDPGTIIFRAVQESRPDLYEKILQRFPPRRISSVIRIFNDHLKNVKDLEIFDRYRQNLPDFLLAFIQAIFKNVPVAQDPFGIKLTCRITKNDTQDTLDSRHLRGVAIGSKHRFNVEKSLQQELNIFSNQTQVFEVIGKHTYSTLFVKDVSVDEMVRRLRGCKLEPGYPYNKGVDCYGNYKTLSMTKYIVTKTRDPNIVRIIYSNSKDFINLVNHVMSNIWATTDIRTLFKKCGIACYFFNMIALLKLQLPMGEREMQDIVTVVKYQCRTGHPLPLNRVGLAKNPQRSPLEVLSFEAPKRNYNRLVTYKKQRLHPVENSSDKIFFGQQFNEGTGSGFALLPQLKKE